MSNPNDTKTLRSLVEAANMIGEAESMKSFTHYISEEGKPERKIGRIKAWLSLLDKLEGERPQWDFEYSRRVKSSVPKAHWYFVGGKQTSGRSDKWRSSSEVILITDEGIFLAEVFEDIGTPKGTYGRWQQGIYSTETFTNAKRHAESRVQKRLETIEQEREMARKQGLLR